MGEYEILCHFKTFQIPLHHSTNKKITRILKKGLIVTHSTNFNVRGKATLSGASNGFHVENLL